MTPCTAAAVCCRSSSRDPLKRPSGARFARRRTTVLPRGPPSFASYLRYTCGAIGRSQMRLNQAQSLRTSAIMAYVISGLLLLDCEVGIVSRLWGKSWGKTGMEGYLGPYLMPLLIAFPLICTLVLHGRLKKWELSGEVSASVSAQVSSFTTVMLVISYCVFQTLSSAR